MDFKELNEEISKLLNIKEAKLDNRFENVVDFDTIGCGFGIEAHSDDKLYTIELSGFSNNTSKDITFITNIPNDYNLSDEEQSTNHKQARLLAVSLTQELKEIADEFDAKVLEVLNKHGLQKKVGA